MREVRWSSRRWQHLYLRRAPYLPKPRVYTKCLPSSSSSSIGLMLTVPGCTRWVVYYWWFISGWISVGTVLYQLVSSQVIERAASRASFVCTGWMWQELVARFYLLMGTWFGCFISYSSGFMVVMFAIHYNQKCCPKMLFFIHFTTDLSRFSGASTNHRVILW